MKAKGIPYQQSCTTKKLNYFSSKGNMNLHKGVSPGGVKKKKRQLALTLLRETSNNLTGFFTYRGKNNKMHKLKK